MDLCEKFLALSLTIQVCLVIDKLYDVPCKILHCPSGGMTSIFPKLEEHFAKSSSAPPIMMGGDRDASSKGVLGTCSVDDDRWLLVLVRKRCRDIYACSAMFVLYSIFFLAGVGSSLPRRPNICCQTSERRIHQMDTLE